MIAFTNTGSIFLSTGFILSFKKRKEHVEFLFGIHFPLVATLPLSPLQNKNQESHLHFLFIHEAKCSRPHFSFTTKNGDTFARWWGVSARKILKWFGGGGERNQKSKAEVSDSKLKFSMLGRETTI